VRFDACDRGDDGAIEERFKGNGRVETDAPIGA
jgi:hypothetical protein